LTLARYQPENYAAGQPPAGADRAIVGLIRSGLLKRFESSVHAFALTTAKMVEEHDLFLNCLDAGAVVRKEVLHELSAADDDDEIQEILETEGKESPASAYRLNPLRRDVRADRNLLDEMSQAARGVTRDTDPKLAALVEELVRIARQADKEGIDYEDRRRKRKVLIFSFYEDTIDWVEDFLRDRVEHDPRLEVYRGRIASVAGRESRHGVRREDAVHGFAPESSGAPPARPGQERDRFDLLLCTDVLAEGMNLQECRNVINYDLPWNPMRLVQRHGRIDRIGSPHDRVFLRTFFPDQQLNRLLDLEMRVRRKLAQAAASVGVEVAPIPQGAQRDQSFTETREEIERLAKGDAGLYEAGGTAGAAQSGEEYRQELRRALPAWGERIRALPARAGSGLVKGKQRGHFFCVAVGDRIYLRFVPASGGPLVREEATCLRLIECGEDTERVVPPDLASTAFSAWARARQDVFEAWTLETDPANLQPRVSRLNRTIAEHLRRHPPAGVEAQKLVRCLEAIEAPCSRRAENRLREVFEGEHPSPGVRSRAVVEAVEQLGLEPFQAPAPLPPIEPDEVRLLCWLAIEQKPG
jgi:hypothetical protein